MEQLRVCSDQSCEHNGKRQPIKNFPISRLSKSGRAKNCRSCKNRVTREYYSNSVRVLGNNKFLIGFIKYKINETHGFVMTWLDNEWVRSQITKDELLQMVRNG